MIAVVGEVVAATTTTAGYSPTREATAGTTTMADTSEAELWGLKPDAPPAPATAPAQPKLVPSERQRWGTEEVPLDQSTGRPLETPQALQVGAPPVPAD